MVLSRPNFVRLLVKKTNMHYSWNRKPWKSLRKMLFFRYLIKSQEKFFTGSPLLLLKSLGTLKIWRIPLIISYLLKNLGNYFVVSPPFLQKLKKPQKTDKNSNFSI